LVVSPFDSERPPQLRGFVFPDLIAGSLFV